MNALAPATLRLPLVNLALDGPVTAATVFDPRASATAHADVYHALPTAFGRSFDHLRAAVRPLDQWYVRLGAVGMAAVGITPFMVYSHEVGHWERAKREGYDATVEMTGIASGHTQWSYGTLGAPDPRTRLRISLAGVNQEEYNAAHIYQASTADDRGRIHWAAGIAYIVARTNLPGYQIRTSFLAEPAPSDDMAVWGRHLAASGSPFSLASSGWMSAGAALASPLSWAAIVGGFRFVITGESTFEIPNVRVGPLNLQAPDLHVYLHPLGPIVEARTALRHDESGVSVEAYGWGVAGGRDGGGGVRVNQIPLPFRLSASPHLGFSGGANGFGADIGTDFSFRVNGAFALSGGVTVRKNDPLGEATGGRDGVSGTLGARVTF